MMGRTTPVLTPRGLCYILGAALAVTLLTLLLIGDVMLTPRDWIDALLHPSSISAQIIWGIRLPRNLTAAGIGAMLGLSGALMQGLLRNPLAEPGILGVSSGAGLTAAIAIVCGLGLTPFAVESAALAGAAVIAIVLTLFIARFPQRQSLILLGVGISSLCGALMALVFNLSHSPIALSEVMGWMLGSVDSRDWGDVGLCVAALVVAGAVTVSLAKGLRFLTLGDDTARSMGVNLTALTQVVVLAASLLAGLSVAVAGIIGFVGLAAPHFVRALGVKDPFSLLWPSALAGALMVLLADGVTRVLPGDVRLGVLTSLIGAPLFAILAYRSARSWMQD
ncbi:MAG: FecCD family ABC transporter permease [Asticcacaulis sp.]